MTDLDQVSDGRYLAHLQKFNSDAGKVVLTNDVKNEYGVLLAAKGERLSENHVSKMINHKLLKPLEECVGLEPVLNAKLLRAKYDDIFTKFPDVEQIVKLKDADKVIFPCLLVLDKVPVVLQKLTIMSHAFAGLFERSLINSALSLSLSLYSGCDKKDCMKTFLVSLSENIGYLHLNEAISNGSIPGVEYWREFYVHPLVAQKMLSRLDGLPASVIRGVGESHERIDGTGFPKMAVQAEISSLVLQTGLIDELTRIKFSRKNKPNVSLREAMAMLQFRRVHFCDRVYSNLNSLVMEAKLSPVEIAKNEELASFARLQLVYYTECMVYCDVVARISEASSLETPSKSIKRLHKMCVGFIQSVFSSGMLSQPIWRLIEECAQNKDLTLMQDMVDIDHAHHGIMDRLEEIFLLLDFILNFEEHGNDIEMSSAFLSLNGCWAFYTHLKLQKEKSTLGWKALIDKMYDGENELSAIIKSMRA